MSHTRTALLGDLQDSRLMYLKAVLFLVAGVAAGVGILLEHPNLQTGFLLAVCIWAFCRLYYFMFYVIEKYVDKTYRFAGLWSFLVYLWRWPHTTKDDPSVSQ
jgi:hypothetical protein